MTKAALSQGTRQLEQGGTMATMEAKQSNPRARANCGKEMIRVRFQAVFYIPDAWSGDDHVANKSNHAGGRRL